MEKAFEDSLCVGVWGVLFSTLPSPHRPPVCPQAWHLPAARHSVPLRGTSSKSLVCGIYGKSELKVLTYLRAVGSSGKLSRGPWDLQKNGVSEPGLAAASVLGRCSS